MSGMTGAVAEAVGMGLLHFTWIGLLLGSLLAIALAALRGHSPRARYGVALGGFLVLAAVPVCTVVSSIAALDWPELATANVPENDAGPMPVEIDPEGAPAIPARPVPEVRTFERTHANDQVSGQVPEGRQLPETRLLPAPLPPQSPSADAARRPVAIPAPLAPLPGEPADPNARTWAHSMQSVAAEQLRAAAPWLAAFWLAGVLFLGLRLLGGLHYTRTLRRRGTLPLEPRWQARMAQLRESAGVRNGVRVVQSTLAAVPVVVGWLRPVVLVPAAIFTGLPPKQVELLLAHELAHIKRLDPLVNFLQVVVETVLFFHPVVWWLSRRIREERELCCDDFALAVCGGRSDYAQALLHIAEMTVVEPSLALSSAGGPLHRRINRILGVPGARDRLSAPGALGLALLTLIGALAAGLAWAELTRIPGQPEGANGRTATYEDRREKTGPPGDARANEATALNVALLEESITLRLPPDISGGTAPAGSGHLESFAQPEIDGTSGNPERGDVDTAEKDRLALAAAPADSGQDSISVQEQNRRIEKGEAENQDPALSAILALEEKLFEASTSLDFEDATPLSAILRVLGERHAVEFQYSPGDGEVDDVQGARIDEIYLIDALEWLVRRTGNSAWVGPGFVAIGDAGVIQAVQSEHGFSEGTPRPAVSAAVDKEHLFYILDDWARQRHLKVYLDPYLIGPFDGADGQPYLIDGFVDSMEVDEAPLEDALDVLLSPLGLDYHLDTQGLLPKLYVSEPRNVERIRSGGWPRVQVRLHSVRVANSELTGLSAPIFTEGAGYLAGDATAHRIADRAALPAELQRAVEEQFSNEEPWTYTTADGKKERFDLQIDSRAWWMPGYHASYLSRVMGAGAPCCGGCCQGPLTVPDPGAGCYFWRGHRGAEPQPKPAYPLEIPFCFPNDQRVEVTIDPLAEGLLSAPWSSPEFSFQRPWIHEPENRPRIRAGRRDPGLPDSAFESPDPLDGGFFFATTTASDLGDSIAVDLFCQSRDKYAGAEGPWAAFRSTFAAEPGEIIAFVTPSVKDGEALVRLVQVDRAEPFHRPEAAAGPVETAAGPPESERPTDESAVHIASAASTPDLRDSPAATAGTAPESESADESAPPEYDRPAVKSTAASPPDEPDTEDRVDIDAFLAREHESGSPIRGGSRILGSHLEDLVLTLRRLTGTRIQLDAQAIAPKGAPPEIAARFESDGSYEIEETFMEKYSDLGVLSTEFEDGTPVEKKVYILGSKLFDISVEDGLNKLLTPLGLAFRVFPDAAIITTQSRIDTVAEHYTPQRYDVSIRYYRVDNPDYAPRMKQWLAREDSMGVVPPRVMAEIGDSSFWDELLGQDGVTPITEHIATTSDSNIWWHENPAEAPSISGPHRFTDVGKCVVPVYRASSSCGPPNVRESIHGGPGVYATLGTQPDVGVVLPGQHGQQAEWQNDLMIHELFDLSRPEPAPRGRRGGRRVDKNPGQDRPELSPLEENTGIVTGVAVAVDGDPAEPYVRLFIQKNLYQWGLESKGEWHTIRGVGRMGEPLAYAWPTDVEGAYAVAVVSVEPDEDQ